MISGRELAFALVGVWRLIRNDPAGLQYFDRSVGGALRSFWVMALVAPAYVVLAMMQLDAYGIPSLGVREVILNAGLYIIDWLLFPVIILRLAPIVGRAPQAPGYVAANNWSQIIVYALALFLGAVGGVLPPPVSGVLDFLLLGMVALVQYRIIRHTLQLAPPQCGLLVFAFLTLGLLLHTVFYGLLIGKPLA